MKTILRILTLVFLLAIPSVTHACEISLTVEGNPKEKYKVGEIVTIKIVVVLQHRKCDVDIDKTDITTIGVQITGATKWVNTEGKTWERKIKVKITPTAEGNSIVAAARECTKDGGKFQVILPTEK